MTSPAEAQPRKRGVVLPLLALVIALGILVGLGTWQLERKAWKEGLVADLNAKLAAPVAELPSRERWTDLDEGKDEFRRVKFSAEFLPGQEALVYTSGSPIRPDVSGPGYWVFSPARLIDGTLLLVNRGFVPEGKQDPKSRPQGDPSGPLEITGSLRWPEPHGMFTPADQPEKGLWFTRDPGGMARAKQWDLAAPFYIDQEAPQAPGGLPRVGPLKPALPNRHLEYAVTWYGLALVILVAAGFFIRARRRES